MKYFRGIVVIWSGWLSDWAASGNVTRDDNRGISSIEYNALGLPSRISVGAGSSIEYIYSADGTKLGSRYTEGRATNYALESEQPEQSAQPYAYISEDYDYIGSYEFRNRNLFRVNTPYGYYLAGEFTPYMRDYQGNNRNEAGYYAYGLPTSDSDVKSYDPYLYGDKMLYTLKGLNIYDFLARTYAPDIARFMQPDPKAGDYHWLSPYTFCGGDPINFVDPDGRDLVITGEQNKEAVRQLQERMRGRITLEIDEKNGKVSYKLNEGQKLKGDAKRIAKIINDNTITVNVVTTDQKKTSMGNLLVGGAFMGNTVTTDAEGNKTVLATQEVNPGVLGSADEHTKSMGKMMMHEVTEAYAGAQISQKSGVSSPPSNNEKSVYFKAHNKATPQTLVIEDKYDSQGYITRNDNDAVRVEWKVFRNGKPKIIQTLP